MRNVRSTTVIVEFQILDQSPASSDPPQFRENVGRGNSILLVSRT